MSELLFALVGIIGGAIASWAITHLYYRRSSKDIPEWAKPLIERFPISPPTIEQIIDFYHDGLEAGEYFPDHLTGRLTCPKCGAPASDFKGWTQADHRTDSMYAIVECPHCGWNDGTEI